MRKLLDLVEDRGRASQRVPLSLHAPTATVAAASLGADQLGSRQVDSADALIINAPAHTGFSEDEAQGRFETLSQAPTCIQEELNANLDKEFRSLMENLHKVMGDSLPKREVSKAKVVSTAEKESDQLSVDKAPLAFPHSKLMMSCFTVLHEKMWGKAEADLSDPAALPSPLSGRSKILSHRTQGYKDKFYTDVRDSVQATPPELGKSLEEYSGVKESSLTIKADTVRNIEKNSRRSLLALNAVDVLVGAIRQVEDSGTTSAEDLMVKQSFMTSLVRAIKHASEFAASAIGLSVLARRQTFVDSVPQRLMPGAAKQWMLHQPLVQEGESSQSLFGNVLPALTKYTGSYNKLHNVVQVTAPASRDSFKKPSGNQKGGSKKSSGFKSGNRGRGQGRNQGRGRGRGGQRPNVQSVVGPVPPKPNQ